MMKTRIKLLNICMISTCILIHLTEANWPLAENKDLCTSECVNKKNEKGIREYSCITSSGRSRCNPTYGFGNGQLLTMTNDGKLCKDICGKHGYSYEWCYDVWGSWGKCSSLTPLQLRQHIGYYGNYCIGQCAKEKETYNWCYVSKSKKWEYCSPNAELTSYGFKCKSDHPCAKHNNKGYYWCYLEPNDSYSWDYCSPPFDLNEPHHEDLSGNFEDYLLEDYNLVLSSLDSKESKEYELKRRSLPIIPTFLYRILRFHNVNRFRPNEGNGLQPQGILSRALNFNQNSNSFPQRTNAVRHVDQNPAISPWVSTSSDELRQEALILRSLRRDFDQGNIAAYRYMVTIDTNYLAARIVNFNDDNTRNRMLVLGSRASNFAQYWREVLVYGRVPNQAIVSSTRFFLDSNANLQRNVTSNPGYGGNRNAPYTPAEIEDFSFEDDMN